jgi:hypothetical protein
MRDKRGYEPIRDAVGGGSVKVPTSFRSGSGLPVHQTVHIGVGGGDAGESAVDHHNIIDVIGYNDN